MYKLIVNGMTIYVRRLRREDLQEIKMLARKCFDAEDKKRASLNFSQYFKFGHEHDTLIKNRMKNWISIEYYVVEIILRNSKRVIGMFGLYKLTWSSDRAVWLDWLAVDPNFRRKGIGLACVLLATRIAKSRNFSIICIESSPKYEAATKLYLKCGFELKVQIPMYFEDGDPLYIYSKEI